MNATPGSNTVPIPSPPPLDSRPKLVTFGDSFTSGLGIDDWRKNYPSLLQADLDRNGYDLQVVNRGRAGDTSTQGLERLDEAFRVGEVRIFVLALGGNDVFKSVPLADTRAALTQIVKRAREKRAKVLLCGYKPSDATDAPGMEAIYTEIAAKFHIALLPSLLDGVQEHPDLLLPDGVHPNEAGAAIVEQNIWKALQPLLADEPRKKQ